MLIERKAEDSILHGQEAGVFLERRTDPSAANLCCGEGLPLVYDEQNPERPHYTNCPVWQLHVERQEAGKRGLGLHEARISADDRAVAAALDGVGPQVPDSNEVRWMTDGELG